MLKKLFNWWKGSQQEPECIPLEAIGPVPSNLLFKVSSYAHSGLDGFWWQLQYSRNNGDTWHQVSVAKTGYKDPCMEPMLRQHKVEMISVAEQFKKFPDTFYRYLEEEREKLNKALAAKAVLDEQQRKQMAEVII